MNDGRMNSLPLVACCVGLLCVGVSHADEYSGSKESVSRPVPWRPASNPQDFKSELDRQGYKNLGGLGVMDESGRELDDAVVLVKGIVINRRVKKLWLAYVTIPIRDGNGHPTYQLEDAFEYELHGAEEPLLGDDSGCASRAATKLQVIAVGTWKWKKNPRLGGRAHSIKHAWVADPLTKRLRSVPPKSVVCEFAEDRD